jgi:membrane protease YdiL (CAAX protease family)
MRPARSLFLYFIAVFGGGALIAPWLYRLTAALGASNGVFAKLAGNPFHRFVGRSLLGVAVLGLYPLWRSNQMLHWRALGLGARGKSVVKVLMGFMFGFGSLACVALLAMGCGGRSFVQGRPPAELLRHFFHAGLAALIVAILEELIFRGTLFGILRKAVNWPAAAAISSAVYAVLHFIQNSELHGNVTWLSGFVVLGRMFQNGPPLAPAVLTLFVAGMILAVAYQRTGTLYFSMGLHAGWIFWLKSYGFFTTEIPGASQALWGSGRLIDGWLALPVLAVVLALVWRMKPAKEGENVS